MIYQDVKRFLKRHLQRPSKELEWKEHDNFLLLNFIQSRYSDQQINNNTSEIRQAFKDFFEPIGNLVVRFKNDTGVHYKIFAYRVKPKDSKHLNTIIEIIRNNRRSIEYPYHDREDQMAILGKIRRHINAQIIETDEAVNKKELVRYAIKQALQLDERDVVIHLRKIYIVKLFKKNLHLNPEAKDPKPINKDEKRFHGYNADDLSNHYNELISDLDIESFLDNVMALLFAGKLNFDEITNNYYEANVLTLIRYAIAEELKQYVSKNQDYLLGFAGYIFRNNFEAIHERIAIEIFEQVSIKNKNAETFLNYYSGTILVENGNRYAMPELSTPDGKRWNIASITATATMWLRTRHQEKKSVADFQNLEAEYIQVATLYDTTSKQYEQQSEALDKYTQQLGIMQNEIVHARKNFKLKEDGNLNKKETTQISKFVQQSQQKMITIEEKILKTEPMCRDLQNEAKKLKIRYLDLKTRKQVIELDLRTLKKNLSINSDAFHSVLHSLVQALIQRKKRIVK